MPFNKNTYICSFKYFISCGTAPADVKIFDMGKKN